MPVSFPNVQVRIGNIMVPYDSVKLRFRQTPIQDPDIISSVIEYRLSKLKNKQELKDCKRSKQELKDCRSRKQESKDHKR